MLNKLRALVEELSVPALTAAGNYFMSADNIWMHVGLTLIGNLLYLNQQRVSMFNNTAYNALKSVNERSANQVQDEVYGTPTTRHVRKVIPKIVWLGVAPIAVFLLLGGIYGYTTLSGSSNAVVNNLFLWGAPFSGFFGNFLVKGVIHHREVALVKQGVDLNRVMLGEKAGEVISQLGVEVSNRLSSIIRFIMDKGSKSMYLDLISLVKKLVKRIEGLREENARMQEEIENLKNISEQLNFNKNVELKEIVEQFKKLPLEDIALLNTHNPNILSMLGIEIEAKKITDYNFPAQSASSISLTL